MKHAEVSASTLVWNLILALVFLFTFFAIAVGCAPQALPAQVGLTVPSPNGSAAVRQCKLPIPWSVNVNVDKETYAEIKEAFEYWDAHTQKQLFQELGYTGVELSTVAKDTFTTSFALGLVSYDEADPEAPYDYFGLTNMRWLDNGCMLGFQIRLYNQLKMVGKRRFQSNMRHEIGHALGLGHSDNPASIMFAVTLPVELAVLTLDSESLQSFYYLYGASEDSALRWTTRETERQVESAWESVK